MAEDDTYAGTLDDEARCLTALATRGEFALPLFRDAEIARVVEHLDRGRSVLLLGPTGAGKTSVVHGVAAELGARGSPPMFEVSSTLLLSGTRYLGEVETRFTRIMEAAAERSAILYLPDVWALPDAARTSNNNRNLLQMLRPYLDDKRLRAVAECGPEQSRRVIAEPGMTRVLTQVEVKPLAGEKVDEVVAFAAERRGVSVPEEARRTIIALTRRFSPSVPQPGPALALLAEVGDYQEQKRRVGEEEAVTPAFVERVFAIHSGVPPFVVSRDVKLPGSEIRAYFEDRVVGQEEAIRAVIETIALFKAGMHDPARPLGTFLFVGPTGVGKTELARAIAAFLFGSPQRLLRFDLSEFKDYHSFDLLLGSRSDPDQPARLLDPVRANPFQVVLFDEIEKAHENIWDVLLPLLDEGRLTSPRGETVDFHNTILIATSNVGARSAGGVRRLGLVAPTDDPAAAMRRDLESAFRPEFLNRFGHVVLFRPLNQEELRRIARKEVGMVLDREGIVARQLVVDVEDEAVDHVIARGVDSRFGARALKREVQRQIVLPIAMTLMEQPVEPGSILRVVLAGDRLRVRVIDTASSRREREERAPARDADGRIVDRGALVETLDGVEADLASIEARLDAPELALSRDRLLEERAQPGFWQSAERARPLLDQLDRAEAILERIAALRDRVAAARAAVARSTARPDLERSARTVRELCEAVIEARRELVYMGFSARGDALVEIAPVGGVSGRMARDRLYTIYEAWAAHARFTLSPVREPMADDEPAAFLLRGPFADGLLSGEAGLHRFTHGRDRPSVARVRVAGARDASARVRVLEARALKGLTGQLGARVKSRVEIGTADGVRIGTFVIQNERTVRDNRAWIDELSPGIAALLAGDAVVETIVRRYDDEPTLVRDELTGFSSGRPDAVSPASLDALLRRRVDARGAAASPPAGDRR